MKTKKFSLKFLCTLMSLFMVISLSSFTVHAAVNANLVGERYTVAYISNGELAPYAFSSSVDVDALKDYLEEQFALFSDTISISQFNVPNNQENINALVNLISCDITTAFHVEGFKYGPTYLTKINYIYPNYCYDEDTYKSMLAEIDSSAEKMVDGLKNNDALSDVQKALIAHDRLAEFCTYTIFEDTTSEEFRSSHNIYGATVTGKAVCQGYTLAYNYLMQKLDISSYACTSVSLNHVWNIIYVNDNYYHVDVTWDDPLWSSTNWDVAGKVQHDYFLVSTEYMMANNHNATDYDTTPTDTSYDTYFWQNSDTVFQFINDTVYYLDNTTGMLKDYDGNVLLTITDKWMASATSYWNKNQSCLATDGKVLFYSGPDMIYAYDPIKNKTYEAHTPDLSMGDYFYVYGMQYTGGSFIFDINNTPNFNNTAMQRVTVEFNFAVPVIAGDINDDGVLSSNDYILIRLHCNLQSELTEEMAQKADINTDGIISTADYITIQMLLKR